MRSRSGSWRGHPGKGSLADYQSDPGLALAFTIARMAVLTSAGRIGQAAATEANPRSLGEEISARSAAIAPPSAPRSGPTPGFPPQSCGGSSPPTPIHSRRARRSALPSLVSWAFASGLVAAVEGGEVESRPAARILPPSPAAPRPSAACRPCSELGAPPRPGRPARPSRIRRCRIIRRRRGRAPPPAAGSPARAAKVRARHPCGRDRPAAPGR